MSIYNKWNAELYCDMRGKCMRGKCTIQCYMVTIMLIPGVKIADVTGQV